MMQFSKFSFQFICGLFLLVTISCGKEPTVDKNRPGITGKTNISDDQTAKNAQDQLRFQKALKLSDETKKLTELEVMASSKSAFSKKAANEAAKIRLGQIEKECRTGEEKRCSEMANELTRRYPSHDSTPIARQHLASRHEKDRFELLLQAERILKERYEISREITHSKCHLIPDIFRPEPDQCPKGPSGKRQRANIKEWKDLIKKVGDDPIVKELKERWEDARFNERYKRKYKARRGRDE